MIEFTHRMMVSGSVFAMVALLAWTWRATGKGVAARVFVVISSILLLNEAFLGALLVKLGYVTGNQSFGRVVVLSVHLSNTLLLVAALTLTAQMLRTGQRWSELLFPKRPGYGVVLGLLATLVVGVTGSLAALGDTLFPATTLRAAFLQDFDAASPWLLRLRGFHPASAFVAGVFVVWLIVQGRKESLNTLTKTVAVLLGAQFLLGVADVILLAPVWMQLLHLLSADLYWIALIALSAAVLWPDVAGRAVPEPARPYRQAA